MAIRIDNSEPLRSVGDQEWLVRAVLHANAADEADWIEWKCPEVLTEKETLHGIAKTILGLANRDPRTVQGAGLGYLLLGVEPGRLVGIPEIDPAELERALSPYLNGVSAPAWYPTYITADDVTVLVIVVAAPRPGDAIFPLRKELGSAKRGLVYVRKHGGTHPADDHDIDSLVRRARMPTPPDELEVTLVGPRSVRWFDVAALRERLLEWIDQQEVLLTTSGEGGPDKLRPVRLGESPDAPALPLLSAKLTMISENVVQQSNTSEEFSEEVHRWADKARRAVPDVAAGHLSILEDDILKLEVRNPSERFFKDVELTLQFDPTRHKDLLLTDLPEEAELPPRPRLSVKEISIASFAADLARSGPYTWARAVSPFRPPRNLFVGDARQELTYCPGDVRPDSDHRSDGFYVIPVGLEQESLEAHWKITSAGLDGASRGTLTIQCDEIEVALTDLVT